MAIVQSQVLTLDSTVLGLVLCLLASWLTASVFFWASKSSEYPDGTRPWPIVGNLLYFNKLFHNPEEELMKLRENYGALSMLWFSSKPVLIINNAEDVKQLLDKSASFKVYQDYEAKIMFRDLLHVPDGFLAHTERFAISVIFSAVYGVRLVQLEHPTMVEFYAVWKDMLKYFQPGTLLLDYFPILHKLPDFLQPWLKLAASLRSRESALHRAFLRTLKEQSQAGVAPTCFGTELVKIQDAEDIDDEKAVNILAMLIGAGADTTSSVLQSFFKVMAMNPEALRKAQKELDTVVGPSRLPTWEDEINLPYIRALIKEVHRWAPIDSLGVPHATSDDDVYQGRKIPKGTIVFPNLTHLSRDPAAYDDPQAFMPERFLGNDLNASASASHSDFRKRDHFHYGFGRRLCQGILVAEASLYIFIVCVLWAFDIAVDETAPPLDLGEKIAGLVTKPKPYRVKIMPRSDAARQVVEEAAQTAHTDILDFDSVDLAQC